MPVAPWNPYSVTVGTMVYVTNNSDIHKYDPQTQEWSEHQNISSGGSL